MRHVFDYIKKYKILLLLVIPAFIFHMFISLPSGSYYCYKNECGYFFWGAHGHDALWHLAIVASSFKTIPFQAPTFFGTPLTGYNFLLDFFIFIISKIGIPPIFTYFKILPIVWFLAITIVVIIFARKIKDSLIFVGLFLFFIYFGGSFGYLITLYHQKSIWGSSGILSMQSGHSLINPQYAFSLVFLLLALILVKSKKISFKKTVYLGLILSVNFGLKFYAGIVTAFIIFLYFCLISLQTREIMRGLKHLFLICLFLIVSLFIFYNPLISLRSGSILKFDPLAIVHPIIEDPQLVYLRDTVDARYYLKNFGIGPRLIWIETLTLLIFLFFNLGTRFFGLIYLGWKTLIKKITYLDLIIFFGAVFSTAMAVLFVQKGEWWNTVQFFYYAIFLLNIYIAELIFRLIEKKNILTTIISIILLILTLPTSIDLLSEFTRFPAPSYVSSQELDALTFLKKQKDGTVFTKPYDASQKKYFNPPYPLFAYDDTSYITAFSGKQSYVADLVQLRLTGIDYEARNNKIKNNICDVLNDVSYIYEVRSNNLKDSLVSCPTELKRIFQNKEVNIYSTIK